MKPSRVLVVSHPSVIPENQAVYCSLARNGWEPTIVVPSRWRHEYSSEPVHPEPLPGMEGRLLPLPVALSGQPGRHFYRRPLSSVVRRVRPHAAFVEAETYSVAGIQWARVLSRGRVPFGIQGA